MRFQPIQQLQTVLKQEYFEPTITWAFRVVLALNIPLIVVPLYLGHFSYEIVWMAFGAYMLALIDYRGLHYKKIVIQSVEAVLMTLAAIVGMNAADSWQASVVAMFFVGVFAALIRNWSDYGASIGVAVGFFFLFGISNPVSFSESVNYGLYVFAGAGWSVIITIMAFPFRPSNPIRRSVAKIWKVNTEFLDILIQKHASENLVYAVDLIEKETAIREAINHSLKLFARREHKKTSLKTQHYDMMMEIRKTSSYFGATLNTMHEELELLDHPDFQKIRNTVLYKTLSAFAQASARLSVVIFTFRPEDLSLAKIRLKRCEIAIKLFEEASTELTLTHKEKISIQHFINTLHKSYGYLQHTVNQIEQKLNLKKSDYLENYKLTFNNFLVGLKPRAILELVREAFNINSQHFVYALRVAIGLSIGVFVYKFFRIDHGHWISLTMLIVIQPYFGATRKKGVERIVGTVAGIVLGGVIMLLPLPHDVFVGLLVIVSFFVAYFLRNNYKVGVFFTTIMMVILMQISQQHSWELIGWRVLSTLIGAFLAVVASYVFWPVWENKRFPPLMENALLQNRNYLQRVLQYYNSEIAAGENWSKHRRVAEAANNDVFASVQRMVQEPEHIQNKVDLSFAMTGVTIRLAREITSIALTINEKERSEPIPQLSDYFAHVVKVFDWVSSHLSQMVIYEPVPDFSKVKESLNAEVFSLTEQTRFVRSELEKIVFELETLCILLKEKKYSR
jgi:uncharacterized membrane protein YccC